MKKCPYCAEEIQDEAIVCRYCGRDLPKPAAATPVVATPVVVTPAAAAPVVAAPPAAKKKKSPKLLLILAGLLSVCCLILFAIAMIQSNDPEYQAEQTRLAPTRQAERTETAVAKVAERTQTAAARNEESTQVAANRQSERTQTATARNAENTQVAATRRSERTQTAAVRQAEETRIALLTPSPTPTVDPDIQLLVSKVNLNSTEAEAAMAIIESLDFNRLHDLEFIEESEGRRYYKSSLGYNSTFLLLFENNELTMVGGGNGKRIYYDIAKGGILDKISNYTLDEEEKGIYISLTETAIKSILKAPSTAKFPGWLEMGEWHLSRDHDVISVQSWVDSQNSFGAMIRGYFTAQYSYATTELKYLEFDGQVVYGTLQKP